MSSEVLHEDASKLGPEVTDQYRAIGNLRSSTGQVPK